MDERDSESLDDKSRVSGVRAGSTYVRALELLYSEGLERGVSEVPDEVRDRAQGILDYHRGN